MSIGMIYACDMKGGIGYKNRLPWRHKPDIEHFWKTIDENPVIMGRKTFDGSVYYFYKRQLRTDFIVLSKTVRSRSSGPCDPITWVPSIERAIECAKELSPISWVVGGATIFVPSLPYVDFVVATHIQNTYPCDTFLPWGAETPPNMSLYDGFDLKPNAEGIEARVNIYVRSECINDKNLDNCINLILRRDNPWAL